ncbi:MAG: GNAT family N-acetyltransferase [Christensenellaceae bacterium]|nr:GNAT family N-acetyltransferase [Christensenellaceae bacterium]
MIRKLTKDDEQLYKQLAWEFYHSSAVLHPVPEKNIDATFKELMRSDEYAECFIFEKDENAAGFALIAKTFSQEAGGLVCWIEELFIRDEYRGQGIGSEFLTEYEKIMPKGTKRLRLEIEPDNELAAKLYKRMGYDFLGYAQMVKELN